VRSLRDVNRQAFLLCLGTGCAACAFAQTSATGSDLPQSGEFEYPSVAAALTALMARSDVDRIYRGDGWPGFTDDKTISSGRSRPAAILHIPPSSKE
jgi:hypothetical protein